MPPGSRLAWQLAQREKAFRAANFYLRKYTALRQGELMMADAIRELAIACEEWLRGELQQPFDGTTVVVTHFAPSLRSADPRYGSQPGTASFCNADDDLLPGATLWIHGHLHARQDYRVTHPDGSSTRVVCNARGHARKGEAEGFDGTLTVDA